MTISTETPLHIYTANGATTQWNYAFTTLQNSDVHLILATDSGVESEISSSNFTLDSVNKTVTYPKTSSGLTPVASGYKVVVYRNVTANQTLDLDNSQPYTLTQLETSYDKLTAMFQDVKNDLTRVPHWKKSEVPTSTEVEDLITNISNVAANTALALEAANRAEAVAIQGLPYIHAQVDIGCACDGSTDDYALLNAYFTANTADCSLFIPSRTLIGTSWTVPANIKAIIFDKAKGQLSIPTTKTLTFTNQFMDASQTQLLFYGAGSFAGLLGNKESFPEWFGAIGDGTTSDNAAIQKCLNTATNIYFSKNYKISSFMTITNANTILLGVGTITYAAGLAWGFKAFTKEGIVVDGLKFVATATLGNIQYEGFSLDTNTIPRATAIVLYGCTNCTIRNCETIDAALVLTLAKSNFMTTPYSRQPFNYATIGEYGSANAWADITQSDKSIGINIYNNVCKGTQFPSEKIAVGSYPAAISFAYTEKINVYGNTIDGFTHGIQGVGGGSSFSLKGAMTNERKTKNIVVSNNVIKNISWGSIWFDMCENISVTGNTCYNGMDTGIDFEGCFHANATGNTIQFCNQATLVMYGFRDISFVANNIYNGGNTLGSRQVQFGMYCGDSISGVDLNNEVVSFIGNTCSYDIPTALPNSYDQLAVHYAGILHIKNNTFTNVVMNILKYTSLEYHNLTTITGNSFYYDPTFNKSDAYLSRINIGRGLTFSHNTCEVKCVSASTRLAFTMQKAPETLLQNVVIEVIGNVVHGCDTSFFWDHAYYSLADNPSGYLQTVVLMGNQCSYIGLSNVSVGAHVFKEVINLGNARIDGTTSTPGPRDWVDGGYYRLNTIVNETEAGTGKFKGERVCYSIGYFGKTAWTTGEAAIVAGTVRKNASKVYVALGSGTTGATAPTHSSGTASDGTITWRYVGTLALFTDFVIDQSGGSVGILSSELSVQLKNAALAYVNFTAKDITATGALQGNTGVTCAAGYMYLGDTAKLRHGRSSGAANESGVSWWDDTLKRIKHADGTNIRTGAIADLANQVLIDLSAEVAGVTGRDAIKVTGSTETTTNTYISLLFDKTVHLLDHAHAYQGLFCKTLQTSEGITQSSGYMYLGDTAKLRLGRGSAAANEEGVSWWDHSTLSLKIADGAVIKDLEWKPIYYTQAITGSTINAGAITTTDITRTCALGDYLHASYTQNLQGLILNVYISATNTITIKFHNTTAGNITLAAGTVNIGWRGGTSI